MILALNKVVFEVNVPKVCLHDEGAATSSPLIEFVFVSLN